MKNFIAWVTTSSADPEKTAMSVKGLLVLVIPLLGALLGVDADLQNTLIGAIVAFISAALTIIGAGMALFGIGRKIYLSRWVHPNA